MNRYTREEMIIESGVRQEELVELEERGVLVAYRPWNLLGKKEEYFTEGQLDVLRFIVKTRRVVEANNALMRDNHLAEKRSAE